LSLSVRTAKRENDAAIEAGDAAGVSVAVAA